MKIKTYKVTYATGCMKRHRLVEAPNKKYAIEIVRNLFKYPITIFEVNQAN